MSHAPPTPFSASTRRPAGRRSRSCRPRPAACPIGPLVTALLLASLAPATAPAQVGAQEIRALRPPATEWADTLLARGDAAEAYRVVRARTEFEPGDYGAQWRAARLAVGLGVIETEPERRIAWFRTGEGHGEAAMEARPEGVEGRVWTAAAKGRLAIETGSAREQARWGDEVWRLTRSVLAEDPDHPMANGVLGKLSQQVSRLSGFQRWVGRTVLGSDALDMAGWDTAETYLRTAIRSDPGMVLFYLDLGETHLLQGEMAEARDVLRTGLEVPDRYPTDPVFKREMRRLLDEAGGEGG